MLSPEFARSGDGSVKLAGTVFRRDWFMEKAEVVLEYIRVFLSPQMVVSGIVLTICLVFREDIRELVKRIGGVRFPGGSEISASQAEMIEEKDSSSSAEESPVRPDEPFDIPDCISLTAEQARNVENVFQAERARAAFWEYQYLDYYLVSTTQRVLEWLAALPKPTTVQLYDSLWSPLIPQAAERRAILNALESHYLIALKPGDIMELTPKGEEYMRFRKPRSHVTM